jgi:hypothetical protein
MIEVAACRDRSMDVDRSSSEVVMATKTVVCPECGSPSEPGRYACSVCGALLASVALTARAWTGDTDADQADAAGGMPNSAPEPADDTLDDTTDAPAPAPAAILVPDTESIEPAEVAPAGVDADDAPLAATSADSAAFDEDAPLQASAASAVGAATPEPPPASLPSVLHDPEGDDDAVPGLGAADPAMDLADRPAPGGERVPAEQPTWPTAPDREPVIEPRFRTPAGAYLMPSAVLPPADTGLPSRPFAAATPPAATPAAAVAAMPASPAPGASAIAAASGWASRLSAALADGSAGIRVTGDGARRAVAVGAGFIALGILLPWVNGLPGAGPVAGYLDRWGMAGPGVWLVFLVLAALATVAASSGRAAAWPVGLPGIVAAAFVFGLVWPYIVGGFGRSIGIWVVLVGAAVLLVGGLLDMRPRHDPGEPPV